MPTIELEPEKPSDGAEALNAPNLYIPASKEIIEALELDMEIQVTMVGKVKSLSNDDSYKDENEYSFSFTPRRVSVDAENEYTELAKENDE